MALASASLNHHPEMVPVQSLHDPQFMGIQSPYPESGNGSGSSDARSSQHSDAKAMSVVTDSDYERDNHWSNNGSPTIGPGIT